MVFVMSPRLTGVALRRIPSCLTLLYLQFFGSANETMNSNEKTRKNPLRPAILKDISQLNLKVGNA